jgi:carbamate kinase
MIGYMIEQELGNLLAFEVPFATLLTQVEVDANDPAFKDPTKFIGPVYSKEEAERLAKEKAGWSSPTATSTAAWWPAPNPSASSKSARSSGCWKRAAS